MADGNTGGGTGARDGDGPDRLTLVLGGGLAVVLLAAVGATGGWMLAGEQDDPGTPAASATTSTPTVAASASPTRGRSTPATPRTTTPTRSTGLTVPAVLGEDFTDARDLLRDRRLGWRLIFGSGVGTTVERAYPQVGAAVEPGRTVTLYVTGPAPAATVPDVVGDECDEAADDLVDEGFYPQYRLRRAGKVTRQDPAGDSTGRWNDRVSIWCGEASEAPGPASPTP
ncbi:PASTA domain-containing protein [Micromonospora phytophila]|uniref:PASTA domain-containing protein n=1 Tax=Micromonospora phytophila TaxID=709888 RepID=UPI00202EA017|nr:PASTA domain-containing protein [Micromonospora phytophila]MCM0678042.1 PASTA domain-containing protein [Micromonospora phytophila]